MGNPAQLVRAYRERIITYLDMNKLPQEMREFALKGYTPEVAAELRKKGWPLLRAKGKVSSRDM